MSGLFGGGGTISMEAERLGQIQLQTSSYGGSLPIVYGTNRVAGNLLDYDDFKAIPHTTSQSAGKGGGGTTMVNTTYTYTAMVVLAIAEGPIVTVGRVWRDKDLTALGALGMTLFVGNRTQTPWSYLTTKHPTKALGYAGTALAVHSALDLGSSGTLKNHSFEVKGFFATYQDGTSGLYDAHPVDILTDLLTNAYYGAGWDASRIGDLTTGAGSFFNYCSAAGFFMSPVINEQKPASEWVKKILEACNADPVWSSDGTKMVLKVIPYGDQNITSGTGSFTANTTPVYDLGADDFMPEKGQDPVQLEVVPQADSFNICPIQFQSRALDYNTDVVEDPEPTDVDTYGPRKAEVANFDIITRKAHALQISRIKAQRNVQCRNRYRFRLGWRYCLLEPMDLVTLTDTILGLDKKVVRIREVEETEDGYLEFLAEEWPFGVATATLYTPQSGDGGGTNWNVDPGNASAPVIFDLPALYTSNGQPEVMIATSGGADWGGCEVWLSYDNATYALAGSIMMPARYGTITALLAAGASITAVDAANTCAVDLTAGPGTMSTLTTQGAADMLGLCAIVDGANTEFISYTNATLTGTNTYNLTNLWRGCYGTVNASHASGKSFVRMDDALFRYQVPKERIGQTVYVKLVSFNKVGGGKQDISTLTAYSFVPGSAGGTAFPAPTGVTVATSLTKP